MLRRSLILIMMLAAAPPGHAETSSSIAVSGSVSPAAGCIISTDSVVDFGYVQRGSFNYDHKGVIEVVCSGGSVSYAIYPHDSNVLTVTGNLNAEPFQYDHDITGFYGFSVGIGNIAMYRSHSTSGYWRYNAVSTISGTHPGDGTTRTHNYMYRLSMKSSGFAFGAFSVALRPTIHF